MKAEKYFRRWQKERGPLTREPLLTVKDKHHIELRFRGIHERIHARIGDDGSAELPVYSQKGECWDLFADYFVSRTHRKPITLAFSVVGEKGYLRVVDKYRPVN